MFRLVHFYDGVRTDRHGERIETHYRAMRFENEQERARYDRDEREESDVPLRADSFFDRFSEVQEEERVAEEMEKTVMDERSDKQAGQYVRKRVRESDRSNAVSREIGFDGRKERSDGSGDQEGVIEVFPKHGF